MATQNEAEVRGRAGALRLALTVAAAVTVVALPGQLPPAAEAASCPSPKTCPSYALFETRWAAEPDGTVVIPYRVNPRNAWVPEADVPALAQAAAATWMRANPRIRFVYEGTTSAVPGVEDGVNVIGWSAPTLLIETGHAPTFSSNGVITEADVVLNAVAGSHWTPCEQEDGACGGPGDEIAPGTVASETQGVLTHELGHWLGLSHPGDEGEQLTMHGTHDTLRGKEYQTLGLGDVLGVRAAYPCGACGGPPRVVAP